MPEILTYTNDLTKDQVLSQVRSYIDDHGFTIVDQDLKRPWGGFFRFSEDQIEPFMQMFFPGLELTEEEKMLRMSPKILLVTPNSRLSWQYHHKRGEIWKVISGPVEVMTSDNDEEGEVKEYGPNELIHIDQGVRHRLIGLDNWGVVAEIWKHTDPDHPSNEDDIVRVQDDFGR